jgi:hypothetical protein
MRLTAAALCIAISAGCSTAGNLCIQPAYFEGDRIKNLATGKVGVVKKRYGESSRCTEPSHPVLADVEFE